MIGISSWHKCCAFDVRIFLSLTCFVRYVRITPRPVYVCKSLRSYVANLFRSMSCVVSCVVCAGINNQFKLLSAAVALPFYLTELRKVAA